MALLLGSIAGFISLTAVVTGVSVTLARGGGASSAPASKQQETVEPTEKKKCTVFLTGKGDTYTIISCGGEVATYYLFSQGKSSLEVIKGISTPNDGSKRVGSPIDLWKERNWVTFKTFDSRSDTGSGRMQESFPIDYKTEVKEFPFSEYIKRICPTPTGVMVKADEGYECSGRANLDIVASEFKRTEKKSQYQNAFNKNGESRCYGKDQRGKWKVVNCQTTTHQH